MSAGTLAVVFEWLRHHVSSLVATAIDFGAMIAAVELLHLRPVEGTVIGATLGGVTNFMLGRHFTFRAVNAKVSHQALRYALVSFGSLLLNATGEHLFVSFLSQRYVLGRVLIASTVNNVWNYPMQRFFVFAEGKSAKEDHA